MFTQLSLNPAPARMTHFFPAFLCWVDGPAFLHLQKHQATFPCACPHFCLRNASPCHPSTTIPGSALLRSPPGPSSPFPSLSPILSLPLLLALSYATGRIIAQKQPRSCPTLLKQSAPHLPSSCSIPAPPPTPSLGLSRAISTAIWIQPYPFPSSSFTHFHVGCAGTRLHPFAE